MWRVLLEATLSSPKHGLINFCYRWCGQGTLQINNSIIGLLVFFFKMQALSTQNVSSTLWDPEGQRQGWRTAQLLPPSPQDAGHWWPDHICFCYFISSPTTYTTEQGGDTRCVLQREELKSLGVAFPCLAWQANKSCDWKPGSYTSASLSKRVLDS